MRKNEVDARIRLEAAALALFLEHGYDRATAAGIARRAGVTERTFFRHFPDKREVLFGGEAGVRVALVAAVAAAPAGLGALDTLFRAFRSLLPVHEEKEPYLRLRHAVIAATPALHERETAKMTALADALAAALQARGVAELRAVLAAGAGVAAFAHATMSWLKDPTVGLGERLDRAALELKALLAEGG